MIIGIFLFDEFVVYVNIVFKVKVLCFWRFCFLWLFDDCLFLRVKFKLYFLLLINLFDVIIDVIVVYLEIEFKVKVFCLICLKILVFVLLCWFDILLVFFVFLVKFLFELEYNEFGKLFFFDCKEVFFVNILFLIIFVFCWDCRSFVFDFNWCWFLLECGLNDLNGECSKIGDFMFFKCFDCGLLLKFNLKVNDLFLIIFIFLEEIILIFFLLLFVILLLLFLMILIFLFLNFLNV